MRPLIRSSRRRRLRARRGFTIVEMLIALMLLTVGVLAVASSSAVMMQQMTVGKQQSIVASLAGDRIERFRAFDACASLTNGTGTAYGMSETWTFGAIDGSTLGQSSRLLTYTVQYKSGTRIKTATFTSRIACS